MSKRTFKTPPGLAIVHDRGCKGAPWKVVHAETGKRIGLCNLGTKEDAARFAGLLEGVAPWHKTEPELEAFATEYGGPYIVGLIHLAYRRATEQKGSHD